jgi:hypothetical protein
MSTAKVKEAITGPCNYAEIGIENEAAETIIEKLTRQGKTIELTYLQVLLDRLFHKATQEQKGDNLQFTQSLVTSLGEVSDILGDFLEEQIRQFDNPEQVLDVLKSFVSIRGTKRQSTVEEIGNHLRSLNKAQETDTLQATIQQLVNLRILREKDENDRYELRHDAMAEKIFEKVTLVEKELLEIRDFLENAFISYSNRGVLLSKDNLDYITLYENKLMLKPDVRDFVEKSKLVEEEKLKNEQNRQQELIDQRKKAKRNRRIVIIVSVGAIISISLAFFGFWQRSLAIENLGVAQKEKTKAEKLYTQLKKAQEKRRQDSIRMVNLKFEKYLEMAEKTSLGAKYELAVSYIDTALQYKPKEDKAIALKKEYIRLNKQKEQTIFDQFKNYIASGDKLKASGEDNYYKAKLQYQQALSLQKENETAQKKYNNIQKLITQKVSDYKEKGVKALNLGTETGKKRAHYLFSKALKMDPNNREVQSLLKKSK